MGVRQASSSGFDGEGLQRIGRSREPHRGFETVTYMIDGILRHQDSNGGGQMWRDSAVAGSAPIVEDGGDAGRAVVSGAR